MGVIRQLEYPQLAEWREIREKSGNGFTVRKRRATGRSAAAAIPLAAVSECLETPHDPGSSPQVFENAVLAI
jgi:hypothetical protein